MYVKIVDGVIINAPKSLEKDDKVYYNLSDDMLREEGYKELVDTPYPEMIEGEEPKYYVAEYEEYKDTIVKTWVESDSPEHAEPQPTVEDRLATLESGLNVTKANLETTMEAVDYLIVGEMEGLTDDTILSNEN